MSKKNLNPTGAAKLNKNELKTITGGVLPGGGNICPYFCFYIDDVPIGCNTNESCVTYRCHPGSSTYGYHCQAF